MKFFMLPLCIIVLFANTSFSQEKQKLSKKERKELKRKQRIKQKQILLDLLNGKEWVLEATTVFDRYNQSYQLNPTINFMGVKGDEGAMQLGFDGLIGWNGVGGVTIDGSVTLYEVKEGKENQNPSAKIRFQGRGIGAASISISLNNSGQATAKVAGDFGERITFSGMIKPLEESVVYKGQSLF